MSAFSSEFRKFEKMFFCFLVVHRRFEGSINICVLNIRMSEPVLHKSNSK
jgi:hypothetical protein